MGQVVEKEPALKVQHITSNIGSTVAGVDLTQPLTAEQVDELRALMDERGVLFFKDQDLNNDQMNAFVAHFAPPMPEPFTPDGREAAPAVSTGDLSMGKMGTAMWHTDTTFVPSPPTLTALRAVKLPEVGGDTCWMSSYAAYDALSQPMQDMLDGLSAVHSMDPTIGRLGAHAAHFSNNEVRHGGREHIHPLVVVNPRTGRKALYFSEAGVVRIVGLTSAESDHICALLREHVKSPDFAMRWKWQPNDVAFWDNRVVQHYAVPDYTGERVMQRVVTSGEPPVGPKKAA